MGVITTISTVDKSAWVQQGQIEIRTPTNARPTMSIRFRDKTPLAAYRPPVDAEITVKDGCDAPGALTMLEKGGGEVPNGTWYFRLVAKDAAGRWSLPGPQGSITTVGGATQDIQFDWTAVDGAVQYRVYGYQDEVYVQYRQTTGTETTLDWSAVARTSCAGLVTATSPGTLFAGVVLSPRASTPKPVLWTQVECAGFAKYCDGRRVTHTFLADTPLDDALGWIVTNLLAPAGITLSPDIDPAILVPALDYSTKKCTDVLDEIATVCGNLVWKIDWWKVLSMYAPSASYPAPWDIAADSADLIGEPCEVQSRDEYADRIILVCGDNRTAAKSQTFVRSGGTVDGDHVWWATDYPASSNPAETYPTFIYGTTQNGECFWGGDPDLLVWVWDYLQHRVYFNKALAAADLGSTEDFTITYTAQYPFTVISDGAISPPTEDALSAVDILDLAAGQAKADAIRAQRQITRRDLTYDTLRVGLQPGQLQHIAIPELDVDDDYLISEVAITHRATVSGAKVWRYTVTAVEGTIALSTWRAYFKTIGGGASIVSAGGGTVVAGTGELPVGSIIQAARETTPAGYLACPVTVVRATYPDLFAEAEAVWTARGSGVLYGIGDGSTTFSTPDFTKVAVYGTGTGLALGAVFGTWNHDHTGSTPTLADHAVHGHALTLVSDSSTLDVDTANDYARDAASTVVTAVAIDAGHDHTGSTADDTAAAQAHSVTAVGTTGAANPPGVALNVYIKY